MRMLIASLVVVGTCWCLTNEVHAGFVGNELDGDSLVIRADYGADQADDPPIQLARHCGPRRAYYHGGWHHHPYGRPYGAYYRGRAYAPRAIYPYPAYPMPYGGSSFGLYIGF